VTRVSSSRALEAYANVRPLMLVSTAVLAVVEGCAVEEAVCLLMKVKQNSSSSSRSSLRRKFVLCGSGSWMYEMGVSSPGSLLATSRVAGTPFGPSLRRTFFLPLLMVKDLIETATVSAQCSPWRWLHVMWWAGTHSVFGP